MKQLIIFITNYFPKRSFLLPDFSDAISEGIKDMFKEMGYATTTKSKTK